MIMKFSKYETECRNNENLLHSLIFTENYKHGYLDKLIPLSFSNTFTDKDFNAVVLSIAWSHNIDITRLRLQGLRNEVQQFSVNFNG